MMKPVHKLNKVIPSSFTLSFWRAVIHGMEWLFIAVLVFIFIIIFHPQSPLTDALIGALGAALLKFARDYDVSPLPDYVNDLEGLRKK